MGRGHSEGHSDHVPTAPTAYDAANCVKGLVSVSFLKVAFSNVFSFVTGSTASARSNLCDLWSNRRVFKRPELQKGCPVAHTHFFIAVGILEGGEGHAQIWYMMQAEGEKTPVLVCHGATPPLAPLADTLVRLGVSQERALRSLAATGYRGLDLATQWMAAHISDPALDQNDHDRLFFIQFSPK